MRIKILLFFHSEKANSKLKAMYGKEKPPHQRGDGFLSKSIY